MAWGEIRCSPAIPFAVLAFSRVTLHSIRMIMESTTGKMAQTAISNFILIFYLFRGRMELRWFLFH